MGPPAKANDVFNVINGFCICRSSWLFLTDHEDIAADKEHYVEDVVPNGSHEASQRLFNSHLSVFKLNDYKK